MNSIDFTLGGYIYSLKNVNFTFRHCKVQNRNSSRISAFQNPRLVVTLSGNYTSPTPIKPSVSISRHSSEEQMVERCQADRTAVVVVSLQEEKDLSTVPDAG